MNYATQILTYLSTASPFSEVILAPSAPPVDRSEKGLHVVLNVMLTPQDIREALTTFRSHAPALGSAPPGRSGTFSFGLQNLGRFKVSYFTQRGTNVVTIRRVPMEVPDLEALLANRDRLAELDALTSAPGGGIVLITGPSSDQNSAFGYALLRRVSRAHDRVIFTLERTMSYLLRHDQSLVLQSEIDTDVASMEEGLQQALSLEPDILYVRDVRQGADLVRLTDVAGANILTFLNLTAVDEAVVLREVASVMRDLSENFRRLLRATIQVVPLEDGRLTINLAAFPS